MILLERERELAALDGTLDAARAARGAVAVVTGPTGIGKSALLQAILKRANDLRALTATGGELERDFAFGVIRQLFEQLLRTASAADRRRIGRGAAAPACGLLGVGDLRGPPVEPGVVERAFYWLLAELAAEQPVAVVVDDAQWTDAVSARWLAYVARRTEGLPVALVTAVRTGEPATAPDALEVVERVADVRLDLSPLSPSAVGGVIEARLGAEHDDALTAACHAATGGNPLFVRELAAALAEAPGPVAPGIVEQLAAERVERFATRRLARLPPAVRAFADAVAILGRDARLTMAAELAGIETADAVRAADRLTELEIFAPDHLGFVHPLLRTAVEHAIPPARRARAHAAAARKLASAGTAPEAIAPHLLIAEATGDEDVVEWLRLAAERAAERGAPDTAVTYLRRALAEPAAAERRPALLRALGAAEAAVGDPMALDHLREAYDSEPDPRVKAQVAMDASIVLEIQANMSGSSRGLLVEAERQLGPADDAVRLDLVGHRLFLAGFALDADGDARNRLERLEPALAGETLAERSSLAILAEARLLTGAPAADVTALARRAIGHADRYAADVEAGRLMSSAHAGLLLTDDWDLAAERLEIAVRVAERRGVMLLLTLAWGLRAWLNRLRGALLDAEADSQQALDVALEYRLPAAQMLGLIQLVHVLREQGRLEDAAQVLERHGPAGEPPAGLAGAMLLCAQGELQLALADPDRALASFRACGDRCAPAQIVCPALLPWRSGAARALELLGELEAARALADQELEHAFDAGAPRTVGAALRSAGLVRGESAGLELLRAAVDALQGSDARLEHAHALVELGAALRRANERVSSREPLLLGRDLAYRCGAHGLAERAHEELRVAGARPRRQFITGPASLTASERRVTQLAAAGSTNREIAQQLYVTTKTVEDHLRHAFQKLGISAREELADALE